MTDKHTLEAFAKLQEPLAKSLNGIDRSLSLLADLELANGNMDQIEIKD